VDDVVLIGASCRGYPLIEPLTGIAKPCLQLKVILESIPPREVIVEREVVVAFTFDVCAHGLADEVDGLLILGNPAFPV